MLYLPDTNFISELRKGNRANRGVQAWALTNSPEQCGISVMTIGEIRKGIESCRKTNPAQSHDLEEWFATQLKDFANNLLPVTAGIADRWGRLMAAAKSSGVDMLIAATALEHDLTVITRNVDDFKSTGARIHNPWK